jgi:hypothetical protein
MKQRLSIIYFLLLSVFFLFSGKSFVLGQGTDIISYSFPSEETGPATIGSGTVDIEVKYGTDLTGLVATFTLSDSAKAEVGGILQESAVTPNDFSGGTVTYLVTDTTLGGLSQNWDIDVSIQQLMITTTQSILK